MLLYNYFIDHFPITAPTASFKLLVKVNKLLYWQCIYKTHPYLILLDLFLCFFFIKKFLGHFLFGNPCFATSVVRKLRFFPVIGLQETSRKSRRCREKTTTTLACFHLQRSPFPLTEFWRISSPSSCAWSSRWLSSSFLTRLWYDRPGPIHHQHPVPVSFKSGKV